MPPRSAKGYYDEDDFDDGYDDYDYDEYDESSYGGPKAPAKSAKATQAAKKPAQPSAKAAPKPKRAVGATPASEKATQAAAPADAGARQQAGVTADAALPIDAPKPAAVPYRDPHTYTMEPSLSKAVDARDTSKEALHLVVLGHVDAGKSTLLGRLISDLGLVDERTLRKTMQDAQKAGRGSFGWAWAFDERPEERERGVTIDISTRHIETERFAVTLLDAPGHKDFVPNMITGATQADAALLVVDGTPGGFEAGFEGRVSSGSAASSTSGYRVSTASNATVPPTGQTREHVQVARSMGIKQMAVVVTKLDTCDFSQARFQEVKAALGPFLATCGYKQPQWLPVAAPSGENVIKPPEDERLRSWWEKGPTLLGAIDSFEPAGRPGGLPLRMIVSDLVSKASLAGKVGVGGKLAAGALATGSPVRVLPSGALATVKALEVQGRARDVAAVGDAVDVGLAGVEADAVQIGSCLCHPDFPVHCCKRFRARIYVVHAPRPLLPGQSAVLHMHACSTPCRIAALVSQLDVKTGAVKQAGPKCRFLLQEQAAEVDLLLEEPLCVECLPGSSPLNRLVLRIGGMMVAMGTALQVLDAA